jgi:TetR/AcrR family transcriptional regulator
VAQRASSPQPSDASPRSGAGDSPAAPDIFGASGPESDTRARLIECGVEEFAKNGLAGARVDAIALRAQLNKQLLYYYFGSKLGLYREVLAQMGRWTAMKYSDRPAHFRAWVYQYLQRSLTADHRRWRRLLMWEALEGDHELIQGEADRRRGYELTVEAVERAQQQGEVDSRFEARVLALAINSIIVGPHMTPQVTKMMTGSWPDDPKFSRRQRALLTELVERLGPR